MTLGSAAGHNGMYVERDITSYYQDESLWDRINGTNGYDLMEGIFPGEYFSMSRNITAPGSTTNGTKEILILGCDFFKRASGANINVSFHHIVCCPKFLFGNGIYDETQNVNSGCYKESYVNKTIIGTIATSGILNGTINEQLILEFTINHLKTIPLKLSSAMDTTQNVSYMNSSDANHYKGIVYKSLNTAVQAVLMSEMEVYGTNLNENSCMDIAYPRMQLPAFSFCTENLLAASGGTESIWMLRTLVANYVISRVSPDGYTGGSPSDRIGIRPMFVLS